MKISSDRFSLSVSIHDYDLPIGRIIELIVQALSKHFVVECVSAQEDQSVKSKNLTIRYNVRRLDGREQRAGAVEGDARVRAHCELLDDLRVQNGTKAIAIALHAHWSDSHRQLFGEHANPATVKRWRTNRKAVRLTGGFTASRRSRTGDRVKRGLRRHHAIRVCAEGATIRKGYERAMEDIQIVNSGCHPSYARPGYPLTKFSYSTFRKDCQSMGLGSCSSFPGKRRP